MRGHNMLCMNIAEQTKEHYASLVWALSQSCRRKSNTCLASQIVSLTKIIILLLLNTGPELIKLFSCSTQLSMEVFLLIYVKMPTIVGILTFMRGKNSILGLSEPKKN